MKFKEYKIKEICDIKSGKRLPIGSDFSVEKTNYPYIRARDIKNGKINNSQLVYINEKTYTRIKKYIINEGDVAITIVANIGDVGYCEKKLDGVNLTENAVRLTNFIKNINSRYLTYYLSQPFVKEYMENLAAGAAQSKLGIYKIQRIKVVLPELEYQNNVVSTISKYDDLIEKNNRKIAILEEQIQELYKEWFVRFRFPGHEKIEHQSGIPNNWEYKGLNNLCIFKRGSNLTASEMIEGNIEVISAGKEPSGYHCKSNVKGPSITISSSGANAGYMSIHYDNIWAADCIFTNDNVNIFFLYEMLRYYQDAIYNQQRGSAQPHVYANNINELKLLMPKENLIVRFNAIAEKIHKAINKLKQSSNKLKLMRDLLLPRLMSGKLEVKG